MQFFKKSLRAFLLSACATTVFVSATDEPDPTTLPFYFTAHGQPCSGIAAGYDDIASETECSALYTWVQTQDFDPEATYSVESNASYGKGCIGFDSTDEDPQMVKWNTHPTGNASDSVSYKLCKNTALFETVILSPTNSGGDPHFIGFNDRLVTYQGECTLILLDSPAATATGEDVMIHVRTTRKLDFSYISGVAMKIGDDVLEVTPNADIIFNGSSMNSGDDNQTMSGLPFVITKEEKGTKKMIVSYSFDLGNGRVINVQANKKRSMMFVRTTGIFPADTTGMLGSPKIDSDMVSRDGRKLSEIDVNSYGESWQVKDTDVQLFKERLGPQYPQKCMYDDAPGATAQLRGRRKLLAKKTVSVEDARAACASITSATKRELCVEDAIAMGDLEIKDDPFYADN
eukprot:CAMPEP_0176485058 /NCGR_PEP_ID=MMETSP0200_2-20121128/4841_1 /TAXON_ID=947934 /ORGANISM="Chaetoceros sp., Strain GSL56" /LENGTH=401 /DNA_ID=CAMNT_0017881685 /DNA_START=145 /DNA_END=1350 /DNA_ORIENTATION=+